MGVRLIVLNDARVSSEEFEEACKTLLLKDATLLVIRLILHNNGLEEDDHFLDIFGSDVASQWKTSCEFSELEEVYLALRVIFELS